MWRESKQWAGAGGGRGGEPGDEVEVRESLSEAIDIWDLKAREGGVHQQEGKRIQAKAPGE